ncbi:thiamine pyrophosphate-binding protein [Stella sp.]|uniref:thiamine pyrophosphate-binding protein n=1 Tax=Stella sp. TaxID=2912054 RepID=UPI0035AF94DE
MPSMTGKRAFLELLKQEGVDVLFGNPGTTELPLMDALAVDTDIRYVLGLHEGVVMGMADGYAQASGKLAVVNLHVAPGLGNAMGMLYDAQKAAAPILVTAGQHEQSFNVTEPILWADLPTMARPLVKWSTEVHRLADLPRIVHRAAKTALAPPTGPVFLSLPGDILNDEAEIDLLAATRVAPRIRADRAAVEAAADLLVQAERPVLVAGDAVAQSRAHDELAALADLLGAPVYLEGVSNTASFPTDHPLYRGAMGRLSPGLRQLLGQFDTMFSVGGDLFTLSLPSDVEPIPEGLVTIHLDLDPWELGKNYPARVAMLGDPKATLPEITDAVRRRLDDGRRTAMARRGADMRARIAGEREALAAKARAEAGKSPVQAAALLEAVGRALPPDAVVIEEALSSAGGIRNLIPSRDPQSFFGLRGGGIGWGLPAAVGVKVALPDRPVVAIVGDGSAMYSCQALWTAARYRLGVVFVILNNSSYRILKQRVNALRGHAAQTGTYVGMDLEDPAIEFQSLARAMGVASTHARTVADAVDQIRAGIAGGQPTLVEVTLDRGLGIG